MDGLHLELEGAIEKVDLPGDLGLDTALRPEVENRLKVAGKDGAELVESVSSARGNSLARESTQSTPSLVQ
jgi:hypothetical protein